MTYRSHPVRRMCEDPVPEASVTLVVTPVDEADADELAADLAEIGDVRRRLQFGAVAVTVPQERVAEVCALEGLERVETDGTLGLDPTGAGEDVEFE